MDLIDWVVVLALALFSIAFFCSRAPANWSMQNRARRYTGTRLLVQAVFAFWVALLVVVRGLLGGKPDVHIAPSAILVCALLLIGASFHWSIRGSRLLKPRRLFSAS